jgi:DNA polymerase-1
MAKKLLLIDGHSMLNRAFYGIGSLTTADGLHTNAVHGFLKIMRKVISMEEPQYLTVAFDVHAPTFRHKKYEAYKGTRKGMPDELREQVPLIQEVLRSMEIPLALCEGYEADDVLGTLSRQGAEQGMDVTILTGDRDLLQLATDKVKIHIPKTSKGKTQEFDYYAKDVLKEYQVTPEEFIDVKALMGDSSDNIPGLPGVGEKTATKLIVQYHSIEEAHRHLDEIKPKKAMESMRDHFDLAVLSKDLATIRLDAPVQLDLEKAKMHPFTTDAAYALCKRLELSKDLDEFGRPAVPADLPEVTVLFSDEEQLALADRLLKDGYAAVSALIEDRQRLVGVAFCTKDGALYYLPRIGVSDAVPMEVLRSVCGGVGHLAAFDLKEIVCTAELAERENVTDVTIGAYLLDPLRSDYPYDLIANQYGNHLLPSAAELFSAKQLPKPAAMKEELAARYAGYRALTAHCSEKTILQKLKETGMEDLFFSIEIPLVFTLASMERAGMRMEPKALKAYGEELGKQIGELEETIYEEAGGEFNINSPKQLGEVLFERLKLPGGKKTKTGYSTAASVLEKLAEHVPLAAHVLAYRQAAKLKSTYADALPSYIGSDGRIHSNFNQTIAATGRISSNEPNLQNIPIRMEIGRKIRRVFVPEEGCIYIDADYSQIELRVLASMSGDETLIKAYREASDIHRLTASQVFHVPYDEVTSLQRRNAKAVNFGIVYGISSFGLSQDLSISRAEAAEYIDHYFKAYPKIRDFLYGLVASAKENGYAETLYGRRRPVPELFESNFMRRQFGERVAMNSPIQGTAADIIKLAMNRVRRRLEKEKLATRLVLQVHDELLLEAPLAEADYVSELLREEMEHAAKLAVDLVVDLNRGNSWYDLK